MRWLCGLGRPARQRGHAGQGEDDPKALAEGCVGVALAPAGWQTPPVTGAALVAPPPKHGPHASTTTASKKGRDDPEALLLVLDHLPYPVSLVLLDDDGPRATVLLQNDAAVSFWGDMVSPDADSRPTSCDERAALRRADILEALFAEDRDMLADALAAIGEGRPWKGLVQINRGPQVVPSAAPGIEHRRPALGITSVADLLPAAVATSAESLSQLTRSDAQPAPQLSLSTSHVAGSAFASAAFKGPYTAGGATSMASNGAWQQIEDVAVCSAASANRSRMLLPPADGPGAWAASVVQPNGHPPPHSLTRAMSAVRAAPCMADFLGQPNSLDQLGARGFGAEEFGHVSSVSPNPTLLSSLSPYNSPYAEQQQELQLQLQHDFSMALSTSAWSTILSPRRRLHVSNSSCAPPEKGDAALASPRGSGTGDPPNAPHVAGVAHAEAPPFVSRKPRRRTLIHVGEVPLISDGGGSGETVEAGAVEAGADASESAGGSARRPAGASSRRGLRHTASLRQLVATSSRRGMAIPSPAAASVAEPDPPSQHTCSSTPGSNGCSPNSAAAEAVLGSGVADRMLSIAMASVRSNGRAVHQSAARPASATSGFKHADLSVSRSTLSVTHKLSAVSALNSMERPQRSQVASAGSPVYSTGSWEPPVSATALTAHALDWLNRSNGAGADPTFTEAAKRSSEPSARTNVPATVVSSSSVLPAQASQPLAPLAVAAEAAPGSASAPVHLDLMATLAFADGPPLQMGPRSSMSLSGERPMPGGDGSTGNKEPSIDFRFRFRGKAGSSDLTAAALTPPPQDVRNSSSAAGGSEALTSTGQPAARLMPTESADAAARSQSAPVVRAASVAKDSDNSPACVETAYGESAPNPQPLHAHQQWHEVTLTTFLHPRLQRRAVLVSQNDVTARIWAERQLARVVAAEHTLLENIFPNHVIEHIAVTAAAAAEEETTAAQDQAMRLVAARGSGASAAEVCEALQQPRQLPAIRGDTFLHLATSHRAITIMFCDIEGFTPMCSQLPPVVVMAFLNDLFTRLDGLLDAYGVYKVETIGDCYVAAGGLMKVDEETGAVTVRSDDVDPQHAYRTVQFAKALLRAASAVALPTTGQPVRLRVGIHSGPAQSGVVGTRMPRFCIFGDTMNTASRMESTGAPGAIHVSQATRDLVPGEAWEATGGVDVKGKGRMDTFLLRP